MKRFRSDLKRAGIPVDEYCFHSLRHTYCTMVVKSGCSMKEAQQLKRHSDINLTAGIYTHLSITDVAGALGKLVMPRSEALRATGTTDGVAIAPPPRQGHIAATGDAKVNPDAGTPENGVSAPPALRAGTKGSAHQIAHQITCFLGHSGSTSCTNQAIKIDAVSDEQTIDNTACCASAHRDSLIAGDRIRTGDVQLGKLAFYR